MKKVFLDCSLLGPGYSLGQTDPIPGHSREHFKCYFILLDAAKHPNPGKKTF